MAVLTPPHHDCITVRSVAYPPAFSTVFVGLAPLVLFITGFVMWWHRKKQVLG